MATYYVNSGASGADNGSSWTDAWQSLASVTGLSSGDVVKVHYTHNEALASWTAPGGTANDFYCVTYISVDKDNSDAYTPWSSGSLHVSAAGTSTSDINFRATGFVFFGMSFQPDDDIAFGYEAREENLFVDCTFKANDAGSLLGGANMAQFNNCTIDLNSVATQIDLQGSHFETAITNTTSTSSIAITTAGVNTLVGCDFSHNGNTPRLFQNQWSAGRDRKSAYGCKIESDTVLKLNLDSHSAAVSIADGTNGYEYSYTNRCVEIEQDTSVYRTDGADYAGTGYTWLMTTAGYSGGDTYPAYNGFSDWIQGWFDNTGDRKVTVYCARDGAASYWSNTDMDDEHIWLEICYLGSATTPTGKFAGTRKDQQSGQDFFTTASANASEDTTSTWTGLGGTNSKMKMEITVNVAIKGPFMLRICTAVDNDTTGIYIDPLLEVSAG